MLGPAQERWLFEELARARARWTVIGQQVPLFARDLGPDGGDLLASDLACLGRAHRAGDLPNPHAAVADLLQRRTNNRRHLRAIPMSAVTAVKTSS